MRLWNAVQPVVVVCIRSLIRDDSGQDVPRVTASSITRWSTAAHQVMLNTIATLWFLWM